MAQKPSYEELEKDVFKLKGVEDALRKNEEKFRLLYERAPLGYQSLDENGNFIEVNQAWLNTLGYTKEEVIGKSFGDFLHPEWVDHFKENFPRFKAVGEILGVEFEMVKKDGSLIMVNFNGKIGKDEKGNFKQTHCILHDITSQKKAEEALRESEERHRNLFETMAQGVVYQNADGQIFSANPAAEQMLGLTLSHMQGRTSIDPRWKAIHDDKSDFPGDTHPSMVALKTGKPVNDVVMGVFNPSKEEYSWILINAVPKFKPGEPKPFHVFTTFTDITERKRAEEALRESEERLKSYYRAAFEGIAIAEQGKLIDFNRQFADIFGYERDELIGKEVVDLVADEDRDLVLGNIRSGFDQPYEFKGLHKDGSNLYIEVHGQQIQFQGRPVRVAAIQDLSERKRVEDALRESEEKYRQLVNYAPAGICEFDLRNLKFISANDIVSEYTGYTKEELFSMNPFDLLTEDSQKLSRERLGKLLSGEQIPETAEYKIKTKNGNELWVLWNARIVYEEEKPIGATVVVHDITERKKAEQALHKSEEKYRLLVEEINDVIFRTDQNGIITFVSPVVKSVAEYDPSDLIGQHFTKIIYHEDLELLTTRFKELLSGVVKPSEYRIVNKSGEPIWVRSSSNLIYDGKDIVGVRGVLTNISEEKDLGAQLQRTQKMESLGLMAGGIAHDLNNILSGIVSYPELILMDLPEDSKLRKPIETIMESGMRAADVVSDLITVARGIASDKKVTNLNMLIEECLGSAEHQRLETMHSFITFKTKFDSDLLNISCSPTHIKKSLTNLVTNASEAIEGSGTVTISTENRYLDEPLKGYEDVHKGEYAVLSVSDSGSGISADDLERIFEPFYTKKVMGRSGTGLGLAVVWNTIQDHNGYINVKTSKNGTAFELYFPVTRDEVAIEGDEVPVKDYMGHGERVLVVDDEERQREIACKILTKLGYDAEAVSSGEEAVEYLKEHTVDLVVLDMIMPKGINGRETYERIIEIHPGQKAIIASGYAETPDVKRAQKLGAGKYIKKPYTMGKIGVSVKEELEK